MLSRMWKKIRQETGAELAEAAVVLPLTFMLLLGIYWFGRAYNIYATITHAAREGARVGVVNTCATCGDNAPSADTIASRVGDALRASKLDPAQVSHGTPPYCACGAGCTQPPCDVVTSGQPQVCIQRNVQLAASPGGQSCGMAVSFQYPYQFYFPFTSLNLQQINLKAQAQMAGEQ